MSGEVQEAGNGGVERELTVFRRIDPAALVGGCLIDRGGLAGVRPSVGVSFIPPLLIIIGELLAIDPCFGAARGASL